jgi:hypothetical protein
MCDRCVGGEGATARELEAESLCNTLMTAGLAECERLRSACAFVEGQRDTYAKDVRDLRIKIENACCLGHVWWDSDPEWMECERCHLRVMKGET